MNSYIRITTICFILLVSAALFGAAETVQAETYGGKCGEDVYWNYDTETEVFKISGNGAMTSAPWKDADNSQYGNVSFYDYELKVVIEKGITSVVDDAFYFLDVKEVILGPDVVEIGESAFSATNLKKVSFSDSVKKIGKCAFRSTYIKSTDLKNVEEVGERAFEECGYLEKVVFGQNLKNISKEAFADCLNLKEIEFRGGAPKVAKSAFKDDRFLIKTCSGIRTEKKSQACHRERRQRAKAVSSGSNTKTYREKFRGNYQKATDIRKKKHFRPKESEKDIFSMDGVWMECGSVPWITSGET